MVDESQLLSDSLAEIEEVPPVNDTDAGVQDNSGADDAQQGNENKDPYHGKSREDVIKEVAELKAQQAKMEERFTKTLDDLKIQPTSQNIDDSKDVLVEMGLSEDEVEGMTASEIVRTLTAKLEARFQKNQEERETQRTQMEEKVGQQIQEAKAKYPLLANDNQYRSAVKLQLNAARADGEKISLDEACQRANALLNTDGQAAPSSNSNSSETPPASRSRRAVAETGQGTPVSTKKADSEEDQIRNAIMGDENVTLGGLI